MAPPIDVDELGRGGAGASERDGGIAAALCRPADGDRHGRPPGGPTRARLHIRGMSVSGTVAKGCRGQQR